VQTAKALPASDPVSAVVALLLIPLLIGGYLAAVLVFKASRGIAAAPWRAAILIGYALVGALLTDLIAGPGLGAFSSSHFWPLLPCFWLVTSAVVLAAAVIQGLAGKAGTLLVALMFSVIGGPPAGGLGTYRLHGWLGPRPGPLPTTAITVCQLQNVTAARPISACPAPGGIRPPESKTLLTAEPLDLDYKHEIIRRVNQERDQARAVRAEMQ